jgi:aspartate carbamoyltransferase regulatory subunit
MNVDGIENGIVLDHIKAGKAMLVYKYLHLQNVQSPVALIQNCTSSKMGKKDIVKISEDMDLDLDVLGFIDPGITVNYIKDGKRVVKKTITLPETLTNVLRCQNPRCITSTEQELPQVFKIVDRSHAQYRCIYCDTLVNAEAK